MIYLTLQPKTAISGSVKKNKKMQEEEIEKSHLAIISCLGWHSKKKKKKKNKSINDKK
mgnify:CR=1 FL=1